MSQKFALVIGNSIYNDTALARLLTPDADVGALADILMDPEYGGYDDVKVLANMSAQTVRRSISSFFSNRNRESLLLLYFSGHGILDDQGQLYLAVKDTDSKLLRATAIPARFVTEEMNNSRSQRQVLVLDCCHSGAFARGTKGQVGASVGTAAAFEGTGYGHVVLTASDATQYAWEGDQIIGSAENSLFTHYMIQGISSGEADINRDGHITVDELYDYIYEQMIRRTSKQTPGKWSYKEQGEIVIANSPLKDTRIQPIDELLKPDQGELEQKLEDLYTRGLSAFWLEEWDKAAQIFQSILEIRPDYQDASTKLEAANRNARLAGLYERADAALEAGDWKNALTALDSLLHEAPNYKDAASKRERAFRMQQLAELIAQAEQLFEAKQWQAVINVFAEINAIEPEYKDTNNLLSTATQEADRLKRQQEIEALYRKAILKLDALQWQEARQLFSQVLAEQPDYRQASLLLDKAEKELRRLQQEQQRQEQTAALYEQARRLVKSRQWVQALANIEELHRLDADFPDPDNLAEKAQQAISRQRSESQKQEQLAEWYGQAVNLLKSKQYQAALEKWAEIQAIDPKYPDRQNVQITARKKLNDLSKPTGFQSLPLWVVPVLVVLGLAALVWIGIRPGGEKNAGGPGAVSIVPTTTKVPSKNAPQTIGGQPDACGSDAFGCAVIKPGETVKIGIGAPMTGDYAQFGVDALRGAQIAIEQAGEFNGFHFELIAENDGGTQEGGEAVANKLVSDPTVVAIAGHIFSSATWAAIPIYEKAGLPMMSPSATNPDLTQSGSKVFNRLVFTDAAQGKFAAEYLHNKLSVKDLAIMHDGQYYGQGLATVVRDEFTKLGGNVVAFTPITPGEADYSAPLADIASKNPRALYYGGYTAEAVVLVNQMKTAGLTNTIFFGDDGTFGQDFLDRTGANGEGAYSASLIPPASDAKTKFDAAYKAKFATDAGNLSPYTWTAYDSAAVLFETIKKVAIMGGDGNLYVPRGALVDAVRNIKDYQGLSGVVSCDPTGECSSSGPTFYVIKDGTWVEAPN